MESRVYIQSQLTLNVIVVQWTTYGLRRHNDIGFCSMGSMYYNTWLNVRQLIMSRKKHCLSQIHVVSLSLSKMNVEFIILSQRKSMQRKHTSPPSSKEAKDSSSGFTVLEYIRQCDYWLSSKWPYHQWRVLWLSTPNAHENWGKGSCFVRSILQHTNLLFPVLTIISYPTWENSCLEQVTQWLLRHICYC